MDYLVPGAGSHFHRRKPSPAFSSTFRGIHRGSALHLYQLRPCRWRGGFREIQRLHESGYRIWYDEGIEPGNDWPQHIAQAVVNCSLFLIFTSPRSAASENCRNEINLALNRKKNSLPFIWRKPNSLWVWNFAWETCRPFLNINFRKALIKEGLRQLGKTSWTGWSPTNCRNRSSETGSCPKNRFRGIGYSGNRAKQFYQD